MLTLLYELAMFVYLFISFPKALYLYCRGKKYTKSLFARFGFNIPSITAENGLVIWVHAASVGEVKAVAPLIHALHEKSQHKHTWVVSTITESGYGIVKKEIPFVKHVLFLPYDLLFCVRKVLSAIRPSLVLFEESEFWYRFLRESKKCGAIALLVNGKISKRSYHRFKKLPFFSKKLFSFFDFYCLQSSVYEERFSHLYVPKSKMNSTGNLKADVMYKTLSELEKSELRKKIGIHDTDQVILLASTHHPEEELCMKALQQMCEENKNVRIIITPRHIDRTAQIIGQLQKLGIFVHPLSKGKSDSQVVIIDSMGLLISLYQIATVTFVGGSYVEHIGGHNILEPQFFGIPVLTGPYMQSQVSIAEISLEKKAHLEVPIDKLAATIKKLLSDHTYYTTLSAHGKNYAQSLQGSVGRTVEQIEKLFPEFFM